MITTIITTYRRPQLLKRAIRSVLNQTYSKFQVCVYDNASNDETSAIVEEFMQSDERVRYQAHDKNIGMMENYEFAFDRVDTPYFHLLSDDDFLLPCFYETALKEFSTFPDAAFVACGIVQLQEDGAFISNPLSFWKKEGYYRAREGAKEMIKKHKFPIPTGVVFQTRSCKDIKPDFTKEIQIYWDPDYLIRIATEQPIVINKTICGVYLVHTHSFAYSVYSNVSHYLSHIEIFLQATHKVISKISCGSMRKAFKKNISKDTLTFVKTYLLTSKYGCAHFACKNFYRFFGFSFRLSLFHFLACVLQLSVIVNKVILKILVRHLPAVKEDVNLKKIEECHVYGAELLQ